MMGGMYQMGGGMGMSQMGTQMDTQQSQQSHNNLNNSNGKPGMPTHCHSCGSDSLFGQKSPTRQIQNSPSLLTNVFLSPSLPDGGIFGIESPSPQFQYGIASGVDQFAPPSRRETPNFRMPSYAARMGPHGPGRILGDEMLYTSPGGLTMAQNGANGVNINGEYYVNRGAYVNGYVNGTVGYYGGSVFSPSGPDGMPVNMSSPMNMNPQHNNIQRITHQAPLRGYDSQRVIQAPLLAENNNYSQSQAPLGGSQFQYTPPPIAQNVNQNGANGVNINGEYYVNRGAYVNGYVNGTVGYYGGSVFSPSGPDGMPVNMSSPMNMNPQHNNIQRITHQAPLRGYDSQRVIQAPLLAENGSQSQAPLGGSQLQNFQNFQNANQVPLGGSQLQNFQNFQNANQVPLGDSARGRSPDILMGTYNGGYYGGRSVSSSRSPDRRGLRSQSRRALSETSSEYSSSSDDCVTPGISRTPSHEIQTERLTPRGYLKIRAPSPTPEFLRQARYIHLVEKNAGVVAGLGIPIHRLSGEELSWGLGVQFIDGACEAVENRGAELERLYRVDSNYSHDTEEQTIFWSDSGNSSPRSMSAEMAYPDETAAPHWENLSSQGDEIANANEDIDAVIGKVDDDSNAKKKTETVKTENVNGKPGPMPLKEAPGPLQIAQPLPDNISYSPTPPETHTNENPFDAAENYYSDSQSLYHSSYGGQGHSSYGGQGRVGLVPNQDPNDIGNDGWEDHASFYSMGLTQGANQAAFGRAMTANSDEVNDLSYGINDMASFPDFSSLPDMSLPEAVAFLNEETAQETSQESGESVTQSQEEKRLHDFADETSKKKSAAAPTVSLTLHSPALKDSESTGVRKETGTSSTLKSDFKSTSRPLKPTTQSSTLQHQSSDLKSDYRSVKGTESVKTGTESVKFANEVKSQELKKFQRRHSVTEMLDALSGQRSSSALSSAQQQRSSSDPADNRDPKGKKTLHHASSKGTLVYTSPDGKIFTTVLERANSPTDANRIAGVRENSLSTKFGDARSHLANEWRNEQLNKNRRRRGSLMENLAPSQNLTPLEPGHRGQGDGGVGSSNRGRSRTARAAHRQLKKETKREEKESRKEQKRIAKEKKSNSKDRVNPKDSHVSQKSEKSEKSSGRGSADNDNSDDSDDNDNESKEITDDSNAEEDDEFDLNSIPLTGNVAELASALSIGLVPPLMNFFLQ